MLWYDISVVLYYDVTIFNILTYIISYDANISLIIMTYILIMTLI